MGKKSGEIEVIRVNPSKNSYNERYNLLERPQIPPTINSNSIPSQSTAPEESLTPIFVASELRDCSKMLEKADIKIIDFDDFVFCTTESKSIPFHVGLFLEDDFS